MKKIAAILITVIMVVSFSTHVFAFGVGSNQRGYARGGYGNQRVYEPVRRVYQKTYNRYAHFPNPGVVVSLPLVPLPGVSHVFPSINIRIR
ncbi:MAG: hypothetical protein MIO92_09705 [Methanosarcinaceae archaeon]|nr:hypothetical protein [Methanosarcinaceae archaeon]